MRVRDWRGRAGGRKARGGQAIYEYREAVERGLKGRGRTQLYRHWFVFLFLSSIFPTVVYVLTIVYVISDVKFGTV